jgi:hypothetical protein
MYSCSKMLPALSLSFASEQPSTISSEPLRESYLTMYNHQIESDHIKRKALAVTARTGPPQKHSQNLFSITHEMPLVDLVSGTYQGQDGLSPGAVPFSSGCRRIMLAEGRGDQFDFIHWSLLHSPVRRCRAATKCGRSAFLTNAIAALVASLRSSAEDKKADTPVTQ